MSEDSQGYGSFSFKDLKGFGSSSREAISRILGFLEQSHLEGISPIKPLRAMSAELKQLFEKASPLDISFVSRNVQRMLAVVDGILSEKIQYNNQAYTFLLFSIDELSYHLNLSDKDTLNLSSNLETIFVDLMAQITTTSEENESAALIPVEIFEEEYLELLEQIEQEIQQYKEDDNDQALAEIKRSLHTLKGSARLVGFVSLGDFVHQVEDYLEDASVEESFTLLEQVVDFLINHQPSVLSNQTLPSTKELLQKLNQTYFDENRIMIASRDLEDKLKLKLSQLEQFSQLLAISNSAGAHIEQQLASVQFYLSTMQMNMVQLEELSRSLEYYSDSMPIKQVASLPASKDFAPLEMDRYTIVHQWTRDIQDVNSNIKSLYESLEQTLDDLKDKVREQNHSSRVLEQALTHVRMIQFEAIVPRLKTMVKQISQTLSKEVHLVIVQAEGGMDRCLLDRLIASFEHMLRNAIDHGIEPKERRLALNKPATGKIEISLVRQASHVIVKLKDDGRGLDLNAIRKQALDKKYLSEGQSPSKQELINMIFQPGFSTSKTLTSISGRGIGLDVVHAEIRKLGGSLRVHSEKDEGTEFIIQLPFTASLNRALIFQSGYEPYGILTTNLAGIQRVPLDKLLDAYRDKKCLRYMDKFYEPRFIGEMLEQRKFDRKTFPSHKTLPVIYIEADNTRLAMIVDKVIGPMDVLVKSLGLQMQANTEFLGASVMGDGKIVFILDPLSLYEMGSDVDSQTTQQDAETKATILLVDDSTTVRKVTSHLLGRHAFQCVSAKDGLEALEILQKQEIDCILLDIEMPRMDGFSFLEAKNRQPTLQNVPVIMISSRAVDKYKKRAFQLGASLFLSKPFQDSQLLQAIKHCIRPKDESSK